MKQSNKQPTICYLDVCTVGVCEDRSSQNTARCSEMTENHTQSVFAELPARLASPHHCQGTQKPLTKQIH